MTKNKTTAFQLKVKGISCASCANSIEKKLQKFNASQIYVDANQQEVHFDLPETEDITKVKLELQKLGYPVIAEETITNQTPWYDNVNLLLIISIVFTLPLLAHMFLSFHWLHNHWVQLTLAAPVFVIGAWYFGKSGIKSLWAGFPNMDLLIFMGSTAAFLYSLWGSIQNLGENFLFYETSASIVTLVLLGNWIEHRSVQKTTSALTQLMQLQQITAQKKVGNNWEKIAAENLEVGDLIQVNTGERIAADGKIIDGFASINQAMLTGESLPVEKKTEQEVFAGTIVEQGNILVKVTQAQGQSVLAQIIQMMQTAQRKKPSIQKIGDKIAAVFVPVVLLIALLTFVTWFFWLDAGFQKAMLSAIAVMVISCPCALGLATPTAVMVGLGKSSAKGVLVKGGQTLETISQIKQLVFDKTGTLTTGQFKVQSVNYFGNEPSAINAIIVAIEQRSNHPLALSLLAHFKNTAALNLVTVQEQKGLGLSAKDEQGNNYVLGSFRVLEMLKDKAVVDNLVNEKKIDLEHFDLFLIKNQTELIAAISLEDDIKPEALSVIQQLKNWGIEPILLSGDKQSKCQQVAEKLGITKVFAEQLPQEKLNKITELSKTAKTGMIGDGINDALALTASHVGISMSKASDIAIQSAEVVLLQSNLEGILHLIAIGKKTLLTIKQSLFWAFFYNIVAIPMAAMGYLTPFVGAAAMGFSDVVVIGNAVRFQLNKRF